MSEEKKDLIKKIEEAMKADSEFDQLAPVVRELRSAFVKLVKAEHDKLEKAHREGDPDEEWKVPHDELDGRFAELMSQFNEGRKKWEEQKAHQLQINLDVKKKIIEDLEKLAENEQHIGHAFERFNELKEKWRATGPVPSNEYRELQTKYSYAIERFFYHINIYKSLKEYDLQKNLQLKHEMIDKVKKLEDNKNIKEVRDLIAAYTKDWDEIGPTFQHEWEKVRDEFWEHVRAIHKKIGDHFKELKDKRKESLEKKEALCEEVEQMAKSDLESPKQWNKALKRMAEIRQEWKKIGFAGKKTNDQVWDRFRKASDLFYESKKGLQEEIKDMFRANEEKKQELINKAEEIKESVDWKGTTMAMKRLQDQWKKIGPAGQGREQKLWKKFRSATNHFFETKKDYFDHKEEREIENQKKKESLLQELNDFKVGSGTEAEKSIKDFTVKWNTIGHVPREAKSDLEQNFNKLLKEKLKAAGKKEKDIGEEVYKMKVEGYKYAPNSAELLRNEQRHLDEKLRSIEADIKQYENNLGFFGGNVENNPLVQDVLKKIEDSKKQAQELRNRLELLQD